MGDKNSSGLVIQSQSLNPMTNVLLIVATKLKPKCFQDTKLKRNMKITEKNKTEDLLNEAIKILNTINEDAEMALSDDWDRSDYGFECQQTLIAQFLEKADIKPKIKTETPSDERIIEYALCFLIEYALCFLTANFDDSVEEDLNLTETELLERVKTIIEK